MVYFYTVKHGESTRYEGPNQKKAFDMFLKISEWITINRRTEAAVMWVVPFEERDLGGKPNPECPACGKK